jgi:hypothetical protein
MIVIAFRVATNTSAEIKTIWGFIVFLQKRYRLYVPLNVGQIMIFILYCSFKYIQYFTDLMHDDVTWKRFPGLEIFCHTYHNIFTMIMIDKLR